MRVLYSVLATPPPPNQPFGSRKWLMACRDFDLAVKHKMVDTIPRYRGGALFYELLLTHEERNNEGMPYPKHILGQDCSGNPTSISIRNTWS